MWRVVRTKFLRQCWETWSSRAVTESNSCLSFCCSDVVVDLVIVVAVPFSGSWLRISDFGIAEVGEDSCFMDSRVKLWFWIR